MTAIFGPFVFPLFALIHLGLAAMALGAWSAAPLAAACLAVVEFITFIDNAVVGLGNRLGIGATTEKLNRLRFFLHAMLICLLVPVYGGLGQLAGVATFNGAWFPILITALTLGVAVVGYFTGWRPIKIIMPVNYYGCLRYAQSVTDTSRHPDYRYSEAELAQKAKPPLASILTVVIGLLLSVWIGIASGFWVPTAATAVMLFAGAFPPKAWGALATSCLEILFSAGLVFSLLHLAGA